MINYNIFNLIISKVALNQWKYRIKTINKEYHRIFSTDDYGRVHCIFKHCCYSCDPIDEFFHEEAYNWRRRDKYNSIYHLYKKRCKNCGMYEIMDYDLIKKK